MSDRSLQHLEGIAIPPPLHSREVEAILLIDLILETMNYTQHLVDILHICDHTDPSQQDLTPHDGRDQLYATP